MVRHWFPGGSEGCGQKSAAGWQNQKRLYVLGMETLGIIKVDGNTDELTSEAGRRRLLNRYVKSSEAGEPWLIPAEQMEVVQVKPLSLNDLAISDSVKLDKQSVAAILGVPPYVVGASGYNQQEWNHFISTTVMPIVRGLEQEMTPQAAVLPGYVHFDESLGSVRLRPERPVGDRF